jgi:AraC-like DNA-binding protein
LLPSLDCTHEPFNVASDAEDTTFADVRESVLRRATHRFRSETDLPIAHIGSALGYSEQAGLTRATRRWFNATPTQVRDTARRTTSHCEPFGD